MFLLFLKYFIIAAAKLSSVCVCIILLVSKPFCLQANKDLQIYECHVLCPLPNSVLLFSLSISLTVTYFKQTFSTKESLLSICVPSQVIILSSYYILLFHISMCPRLPFSYPLEHTLLPPTFLPSVQLKAEHTGNPTFCTSAAIELLGKCGLTLLYSNIKQSILISLA